MHIIPAEKKCAYLIITIAYKHCKPVDLQATVTELYARVGKLEAWSREANLVINPEKTKVMLMPTSQLSRVHLDTTNIDLTVNDTPLKRVATTKLLGSYIHEHLNWEENVKHTAASCYATLTSIKKLKKILPMECHDCLKWLIITI